MYETLLSFLAIVATTVITGFIGFAIYDYCRNLLPKQLDALVLWRLRRLYPDNNEWSHIYDDWHQDLLDMESTLQQIWGTIIYLKDIKKLDVPLCTSREIASRDSEG